MKALIFTAILGAILTIEICKGNVLISDHSMSRMIELTTRAPFCHIYTDRGKIRSMVLGTDPRRVRQMSDDAISKLDGVCRNNEVRSSHQGGFIYPGTKWCGPGTIAKNYTDLGLHRKEDMCCREHDNCPKRMVRGECRQGICNKSPFTRSHCDCDATFRRCLQNVNTETANTIGAIFFNIVQIICFKERSPCSQLQNLSVFDDDEDYIDLLETNDDCPIEFQKNEKYIGSEIIQFQWENKREFIINRNGYSKAESDELCAQWKYRPSDKYIPLMPLSSSSY